MSRMIPAGNTGPTDHRTARAAAETARRPRPPAPPKDRLTRAHDALVSPGGRLVRYLLVLLIVVLAIIGSLTSWFQLCEVVTTEKGTTTTCSAPDLTNAGVLAAVLLVLLLIWPDLSEFSAFGVTVKRLVIDVKKQITGISSTLVGTSRTLTGAADDISDVRRRTRSTARTTTRIDERTAETLQSLERVQQQLTETSDRLHERLSGIENSVGTLAEARASRRPDPPAAEHAASSSAAPSMFVPQPPFDLPGPSGRSSERPRPRTWRASDGERLADLAAHLFPDDAQRDEYTRNVYRVAADLGLGEIGETLQAERSDAVPIGVLIAMYRVVNAGLSDSRVEYPDERACLEVVELAERLIHAVVDGQVVDTDSVYRAIVTLWLLTEQQGGR